MTIIDECTYIFIIMIYKIYINIYNFFKLLTFMLI